MILQSLYQLAQEEGLVADPDFEWKPVPWLIVVDRKGELVQIVSTRSTPGSEKKIYKGKVFRIPRQSPGRSGTKPPPEFLVDNATYVLGMGTPDKPIADDKDKAKAASRAESFRRAVLQCANATGDEGVCAVARFLHHVQAGQIACTLAPEARSNDLFAFVYAPDVDCLLTDRPVVEAYWRGVRGTSGAGLPRLCLVSGRYAPAAEKHKMLKNLPGAASSGAALVSFNSSAFESYGWKRHENAAVSVEVAEACGTALNRLLDAAFPDPARPAQTLPRRHLKISSNTVVCYWTAGGTGGEFCSAFEALLEANPELVGEKYRSIWWGRAPDLKDATPFYALTMSGTQGRAAVRDWIESTVERVSHNLAQHFADISLLRNTPRPKGRDLPPQMSLKALLEAVVSPNSAPPGPLVRAVVEAVVEGSMYPISLLQQALLRERAEIGNTAWLDVARRDARAALIKAVLNRRKRLRAEITAYEEITTAMDPMNGSEGYALGRLMAVLERIQQEAHRHANASLVDRCFSRASATPKIVFVQLLRTARHQMSEARDNPQRAGMAFRLGRLMDDLVGRFEPSHNGFPAHLDLEQQALFVLGYHQMRRWIWMNNEERDSWERDHANAPRAYLWKTAQRAPIAN